MKYNNTSINNNNLSTRLFLFTLDMLDLMSLYYTTVLTLCIVCCCVPCIIRMSCLS